MDMRFALWRSAFAQGNVPHDMPNQLTKIPARYESSAIDDELVLIDVDTGKFFALKEVGLRIWNLLDDEAALDRIAAQLCDEYDVELAHAQVSVKGFADSLVEAGFARFV